MLLVRLHGILELRVGTLDAQVGVSSLLLEYRGSNGARPKVLLKTFGWPGLLVVAIVHGAVCIGAAILLWFAHLALTGGDRPRLCW